MRKTLYLDLATVSGYALGTVAGVLESGVIELPRTGEDFGTFLLTAQKAFGDLLDRLMPDQVGYEQPILKRNGKMQMHILRKLYILGPALESAAITRKIPTFEALQQNVLVHFLGRGNVPIQTDKRKSAVKNRCRQRGWDFHDDNEADALAGLDYSIACDAPAHALAGSLLFDRGRDER